MTLSLEIIEGHGAGRRFDLARPLQIGSGPEAAIRLGDPQVSRAHASVVPDQTGAVVVDLGSANGTFVNGHQLAGPARLGPGDHLLVGSTVLELRTAAQVASRPSAAVPVPPALAMAPMTPEHVPPALDGPAPDARPLDALLGGRAGRRAGTVPLAVFVLAVLALLVLLATR